MPYERFWERSDQENDIRLARGVHVLERLCERNAEIGRDEMLELLGAANGREIHAQLSMLFVELAREGEIRSNEVIERRGEGKKSTWSRGPRCAQALHIARLHRDAWTQRTGRGRVTITDVPPDVPGPKIVLRTMFCSGEIIKFRGGREALAEALEDDAFTCKERWSNPAEIFIERIEGESGRTEQEIPIGYGEHGLWVRGKLDHSAHEVPEEVLGRTGETLYAYVKTGRTVERTIALGDPARQTDEVRTRRMGETDLSSWWRSVDEARPQRHVCWVSTDPYSHTKWAPALEMRARCWRDVTIGLANGGSVTISVEGMRGEDARTAVRAISRWRAEDPSRNDVEVEVQSIRIARRQPRPIDPPTHD